MQGQGTDYPWRKEKRRARYAPGARRISRSAGLGRWWALRFGPNQLSAEHPLIVRRFDPEPDSAGGGNEHSDGDVVSDLDLLSVLSG